MSMTNIAFSGMNAAQAGMSATAMNLANANTPGYNRQRVDQSSLGATSMGNTAGEGVNIDAFVRISEQSLVNEQWKQSSQHHYFVASQHNFTKLEQTIGNEDIGVAAGIRDFFNSASEATVEPASMSYRNQMLHKADAVALSFSQFNESVKEQKQLIATQRTAMVKQVNGLLKDIHECNQKIVTLSSGKVNTSALQDSRDEQVKKLSEMLGIRVMPATDGGYSITLKNGSPLIHGQAVGQFNIDTSSGSPAMTLRFANNDTVIDMSCGGGLGSINDYESGILAKMQESVQQTAEQLANNINDQLALGTDLTGNTGNALFKFDISNPEGMLVVTGIKAEELAFSGTPGAAGDAGNLHKLLGLKENKLTLAGIGETTLGAAGSVLVGEVAFASSNNKQSVTQTKNMLDIAMNNRDSLSGVNNDEEGGNFLEYSKAYRANMKVVATGDQLFSELLALFR